MDIMKAKQMREVIAMLAVLHTLAAAPTRSTADPGSANPGVPWPATDALGRTLPTPGETGPPRPDRFVGIFYFLWHDEAGGRSPHWDGPYDVARILAQDPDALKKPDSPLW